MADDVLDAPKVPTGGGKKSKLADWVKKNKTLAVIIAAGGGYFIWHELHAAPGGESEEELTAAESGQPVLPGELSHEGIDEELNNIREELKETRDEKEKEGEGEGEKYETLPAEIEGSEAPETVPNEPGTSEDGPGAEADVPGATTTPSSPGGVSIHGRNFPGATGSRIAGTGQLPGGKKYIEYVITYPGKNEHWRYFPESGNWSLANNSAATPGAGAAKTKAAANPSTTFSPGAATKAANAPAAAAKAGVVAGSVKVSKGGGVTAKSSNTGKTVGIGAGKAVSGGNNGGKATGSSAGGAATNNQGGIPQNNAQHPNAVNTGNPCINGGVGGHTPPPGYHLFCQGGWIWRAPN